MADKKNPPNNREWISVGETLEHYPVGRTRFYEMLKNGEIEARKFGNRTLVNRPSADRLFSNLPRFGAGA